MFRFATVLATVPSSFLNDQRKRISGQMEMQATKRVRDESQGLRSESSTFERDVEAMKIGTYGAEDVQNIIKTLSLTYPGCRAQIMDIGDKLILIDDIPAESATEIESLLKPLKYKAWRPEVQIPVNVGQFVIKMQSYESPDHKVERQQSQREEYQENHPTSGMGVTSEQLLLPYAIPHGSKLLDVGSGSGIIAKRMRDELSCDVYAVEPGLENSNNVDDVKNSYQASCNQLGADHVGKYLAQEAALLPQYIKQFDVVTAFKWNVPSSQSREAIHALAKFVKPGGVVIVHVVERAHLKYYPKEANMYLLDYLHEAFDHVSAPQERAYGKLNGDRDMICVCRNPKL